MNKSLKHINFILILISLVGCSAIFKSKKKNISKLNTKQEIVIGPTERGDGSFIDVTKEYGLDQISGVRFNAVDLNNDGETDLVVLPTFYSQPRFLYFDKSINKFVEHAYIPFAKATKFSFMLFYDLDKDDVIDLIGGVLNQKTELTKHSIRIFKGNIINKRIWFTELEDTLNSSPEPTASVSLIDVNLDGELDIFQANWFTYDKNNIPWPVHDRLFIKKNNKYSDKTDLLFGETDKNETRESYIKATPSFSSSTCDVDGNGFPDILTTSTNGYKNKLWLNEFQFAGSKRNFRDYGDESLFSMDTEGFHVPRGGGRTFFAGCADYNDDGLMDVYLGEMTHSYDSDSVDRSSILTSITKNFPPKFLRTEYLGDSEAFNWSRADKRGNWEDFNLDGKLDLMVDNSGHPPHSRIVLFTQDEIKDFYDTAKQKGIDLLNPEGTIILDINKDGKPDFLTGQSNIRMSEIKQSLYLFLNNHQSNRKFIRFFPRGNKANSSALGATLLFNIRNKEKVIKKKRYIEYSRGNLPSQNEEGIFISLDNDEILERVEVKWPIYQNASGSGRSYLEKNYTFDTIKFKSFNEITLCEDGRVFLSKKFCR